MPHARRRWLFGALGVALFVIGTSASRVLEPGVAVEETRVGDLPALRIHHVPLAANAPRALIEHGFSASKETMFRFAEALAAAGFDCLAFDARGHGASRRSSAGDAPGRLHDYLEAVSVLTPNRREGPPVLLGHSMGAYVAGEAISEGGARPQLLVAVGAQPDTGEHPPPRTLFLLGAYDELLSPSAVSREAARLPGGSSAISPFSDHALEPFDPRLVSAATEAACAAVGLPAPRPTTAWLTRLVGCALILLGTLFLLQAALPRTDRALTAAGLGSLTAMALIGAAHVGLGRTWLGTALIPERLPRQLAFVLGFALLSEVLRRSVGPVLGRKRFLPALGQLTLVGIALAGAVALHVVGASFVAMAAELGAALLALTAIAGALTEWRVGHPAAATAVFALLMGYALGQWLPL